MMLQMEVCETAQGCGISLQYTMDLAHLLRLLLLLLLLSPGAARQVPGLPRQAGHRGLHLLR
jgi:hypothetical protein